MIHIFFINAFFLQKSSVPLWKHIVLFDLVDFNYKTFSTFYNKIFIFLQTVKREKSKKIWHLYECISKTPTREIPTWSISSHDFNNLTQIFNYFVFSLLTSLSLILIKRLFCSSIKILKSDLLWCIKKFVACRPELLQTKKRFYW